MELRQEFKQLQKRFKGTEALTVYNFNKYRAHRMNKGFSYEEVKQMLKRLNS